jgi:hypothetical protein
VAISIVWEGQDGNEPFLWLYDQTHNNKTYSFLILQKVSNPPFFFSHAILLHFPTHSSLSRLQQTTKQTPSIKILLIKTKNKKHKTKVTRKSQHFPSLHFGRNQPHHGQRVLILCRKQVLACNNPCSESSILVQQLKGKIETHLSFPFVQTLLFWFQILNPFCDGAACVCFTLKSVTKWKSRT